MLLRVLILLLSIFEFSFGVSSGAIEVNRLRAKAGMVRLKYNSILAKSAHNHAKYLARLRLASHFENPKYPYFTGKTPFDRMAKAGYPSRVGVENISFAERSYKKSVEVLFSTIYHRLAFLDFRIDSIGTSAYGNIKGRVYVYEMSSSEVAKLCQHPNRGKKSGRVMVGVCSKRGVKIYQSQMQHSLLAVEKRNRRVVLFPYPNARNIPRAFVNETPNPFRGRVKRGFPVTVELNPARYRTARLKRFRIFGSKKEPLKAKIITAKSDIRGKLSPLTFVLVPNRVLKPNSKYSVEFIASTNRGEIKRSWSFRTK